MKKTNSANFTGSDAYKAASALVAKPNAAFAYLDTRPFFERAYGALKPLAMLGSAFLFPHVSDYVDLAKLPQAETISRHLSPTIFSEASDDQGLLLESVGPFTFMQAAIVGPGAIGAIAAPYYFKGWEQVRRNRRRVRRRLPLRRKRLAMSDFRNANSTECKKRGTSARDMVYSPLQYGYDQEKRVFPPLARSCH